MPAIARRSLLLAVLLLGLAVPGPALGDGDPASDVLYFGKVFFPYSTPVGQVERNRLTGVVDAARRAGYPIKVAVIAGPSDLGAVPDLFGRPQDYAKFLGAELSLGQPGRLLVVMPAGFGYAGISAKAGPEQSALGGLKSGKSGGDQLSEAATAAVVELSRAAGHPIAAPAPLPHAARSHPSRRIWILTGVGIAIMLAVVVLTGASRRGRPSQQPPDWPRSKSR